MTWATETRLWIQYFFFISARSIQNAYAQRTDLENVCITVRITPSRFCVSFITHELWKQLNTSHVTYMQCLCRKTKSLCYFSRRVRRKRHHLPRKGSLHCDRLAAYYKLNCIVKVSKLLKRQLSSQSGKMEFVVQQRLYTYYSCDVSRDNAIGNCLQFAIGSE
jgi:hypothetical protein